MNNVVSQGLSDMRPRSEVEHGKVQSSYEKTSRMGSTKLCRNGLGVREKDRKRYREIG